MRVSRLRVGEAIAGIGGLALLLVMTFPAWFQVVPPDGIGRAIVEELDDAEIVDTTYNAWQAFQFLDGFLLLTALAGIALAVATMAQRSVAVPVALSVGTSGLGVVATLLLVYRLIDPPSDVPNEFIELRAGAWLGLLSCLAIAGGAWQAMRDEGTGAAKGAEDPLDPTGKAREVRPAPPPAGVTEGEGATGRPEDGEAPGGPGRPGG
jgi:hypothetical protein